MKGKNKIPSILVTTYWNLMLHLFNNITIVVDFFGNLMINKPQNYIRMEFFGKTLTQVRSTK
jgi:hypothetical protein